MISIPNLVTILESIRELAALFTYNDQHNDWLDFPLTGDVDWEATQTSLLQLLPHSESGRFSMKNEIPYPSMIYDSNAPGYVLIFLANDNVIVSEYDHSYRIVGLVEALEYLTDKIKNGHLGNPGGGELTITDITGLTVTEGELLDNFNFKYLSLVRRIVNTDSKEVREVVISHVGVESSWAKKSDTSLLSDLVVECTERYNGILEEFNIFLDSLDEEA